MKSVLKLLIGVLLALCVFRPHEAKAYCYRYYQPNDFSDTANWNEWGNWTQPGSFVSESRQNGHFSMAAFEPLANTYEVLERVFKISEVNQVSVGAGCYSSPQVPPDSQLNRLSACQASSYVLQASGLAGTRFSIQLINPVTYAIISQNDYDYSHPTANYSIFTPFVTTGCVPDMLLRVVVNRKSYSYSEGLVLRDAQVSYYTN